MNIPWNKIEKTDKCWNWLGTIKNGYGQYYKNGKKFIAHRFVYENIVGKIPFAMVLDHLCKNKKCVNPAHLEVVSIKENTLRGNGVSGINLRKQFCNKGHPYDFENTSPRKAPNGRFWRVCKKCRKEYMRNFMREYRKKS